MIYLTLALSGIFVVALLGLRLLDWRSEQAEWTRLAALQPDAPVSYDPKMVAELPEPAQRYFNYTITPGTPLLTVAEIEMGGQFSLGSRDNPSYQTMEAYQILAAPHGFVWRLNLPGKMPVSGSDSGNWTRFRILGLLPVARIGGNPDHAQSAYGRYIAESLLWTPAAVLPGPGVVWEGVNINTARVTVRRGELSQAVDVTVDADGQPAEVSFIRWSNANPHKKYQHQPFGATLADFREVQGYRVPFIVEAGNMFGTDSYFPFFKAELTEIRYPKRRK